MGSNEQTMINALYDIRESLNQIVELYYKSLTYNKRTNETKFKYERKRIANELDRIDELEGMDFDD